MKILKVKMMEAIIVKIIHKTTQHKNKMTKGISDNLIVSLKDGLIDVI